MLLPYRVPPCTLCIPKVACGTDYGNDLSRIAEADQLHGMERGGSCVPLRKALWTGVETDTGEAYQDCTCDTNKVTTYTRYRP